MISLVNDKTIMRGNVNGLALNILSWAFIGVLSLLSIYMILRTAADNFGVHVF
jgi:Mn2+/Fe2+ NRAMP family transporter